MKTRQLIKLMAGMFIVLVTSGCGGFGGGGGSGFFGGSIADAIGAFASGASGGLPDFFSDAGSTGAGDVGGVVTADDVGGGTTILASADHAVVYNPEPSSLALLGMGVVAAASARKASRRSRKKHAGRSS